MNTIKSNRAVIDIENGGFSKSAGMVEVAIVVIDENYNVLETFSAIVQRYFIEGTEELMKYDQTAIEIHGITEEDQKREGQPPRKVVNEVENILQTYNVQELIAHNGKIFDFPQMAKFFERFSIYKPNPFEDLEQTDTLEMARFQLGLRYNNLGACCKYFGIENKDHHRALNDAIANTELLKCLEQ